MVNYPCLASILEAPENEYAYALSRGVETWIGLEWNNPEQQFKWSDNWPVWYTKWGDGYPDANIVNSKGCVALKEKEQQSEWVQSSCNEQKVNGTSHIYYYIIDTGIAMHGPSSQTATATD